MTTRTTTIASAGVCDAVVRSGRRGMLMLEVVIALAIGLTAIAVCGAAMRNSLLAAEHADRVTRAMMLTESLLMHLDTGLIEPEQDQTGDFGEQGAPGMSWRLELLPDERNTDMLRVTATVYLGNPDGSENERRIILETQTLRAAPRRLNLRNDFGMTDEQIQMLTDAIPGGAGMLDPEDFDPTSLARLDMDTLVQLLPTLMQLMGSSALGEAMQGGTTRMPALPGMQPSGGGRRGGPLGGGGGGRQRENADGG
jgi:hypothetical protein